MTPRCSVQVEVEILQKVSHPNIVQLRQVSVSPPLRRIVVVTALSPACIV